MTTGALIYQLTPRGTLRGVRVYADGDLSITGVRLHRYYTYDITERVIANGDCVVITKNPLDVQFYHENPVALTGLEHPAGRIMYRTLLASGIRQLITIEQNHL